MIGDNVISVDIECTGTDEQPHTAWPVANFAYEPRSGRAPGWVLYGERRLYKNRDGKLKRVRMPQLKNDAHTPDSRLPPLKCVRCPLNVVVRAKTLHPVLDNARADGVSTLRLYDIAANVAGNAV